jgi:prophage regulatory protein
VKKKKPPITTIRQAVPYILPETGFLRIWQIIGCLNRGIIPLIPVSHATWWNGIKSGKYPHGVKLAPKITAWVVKDIRELIAALEDR